MPSLQQQVTTLAPVRFAIRDCTSGVFSQQCTVSHDRYYRFLTYCNQSQSVYPYDPGIAFSDSIWQNRHRESDSCFAAVYPYGKPQLFMGVPAAGKKDKSVAEDSVITYVCMFHISM